jgi:Asp-tRNA(Asn)/Glu-tRNA(Gln) amidotransferase A subunit family amidase
MVPLALGTQTKGSVLRPASYCGVTWVQADLRRGVHGGVLPLSVSLDTVGFFTHTPADMLALWDVLHRGSGNPHSPDTVFGVPERMPGVDSAMAEAFQNAISRLRAAGASVHSVDIWPFVSTLNDANDTVMIYEGARFHRERYEEHGSRLDELAELVRRGLTVSDEEYAAAKGSIDANQAAVGEIFKSIPIILVPAATGPAPSGLSSTGDARMNAPWTTLGTPPSPSRCGQAVCRSAFSSSPRVATMDGCCGRRCRWGPRYRRPEGVRPLRTAYQLPPKS